MLTIVVGGQPPGNMRIRIRYVSWIQSNFGLGFALSPASRRRSTQRAPISRSGLSSYFSNLSGCTYATGDFAGFGFVATSISSPNVAQCAPCTTRVSCQFHVARQWNIWKQTHHNYNMLDAVGKRSITTIFPVSCRLGLLAQHHS